MKTDFVGETAPIVLVKLDNGEKIYLDNDLMLYKEPTVKVERKVIASPSDRFKLHVDNVPSNRYFGVFEGPGHVAISHDKPGECRQIMLQPGQVSYLRWGSLLFAQESVQFEPEIRNFFKSSYMSKYYWPLEKMTGPGLIYVQAFGNVFQFTLNGGEAIDVPLNSLLYFDGSTQIPDIEYLFFYKAMGMTIPPQQSMKMIVILPGSPESYSMYARVFGPGTVMVHSGR